MERELDEEVLEPRPPSSVEGAVLEVGGKVASGSRDRTFIVTAVAAVAAYAVVEWRVVLALPMVLMMAVVVWWRGERRPTRLEAQGGSVALFRRPGRAPERVHLDEIAEAGAGVAPEGRVVWIRRLGEERKVLIDGLSSEEAKLVLRMLRGQSAPPRTSPSEPTSAPIRSSVAPVIGGAVAGVALLLFTEWSYARFKDSMAHPEDGTDTLECAPPETDARAPAVGALERVDEKMLFARATLETDSLLVHFDPRVEGVSVPPEVPGFRWSAVGRVEVGHDLPRPIPDLRVDEHGVRATLSFGELGLRPVDIPWAAVFALSPGSSSHGMVFAGDVPQECVAAYGL